MNANVTFWVVLLVLIVIMWFCDRWYGMLRDTGTGEPRPYSYARVQMAWWMVLIFSAMITILFQYGRLPTLPSSMLVVLGISAGTTTAARLIDQSDLQKNLLPGKDVVGVNFVLDLLSDKTGVSIHRLQTFILNVAYGVWFIYTVLHNLNGPFDAIIPSINDNDLILLGLSSGTYAALKTTENKEPAGGGAAAADQQALVPDEGKLPGSQAAG